MRPKELNILGRKYTVEYVNSPAEVDPHKRESLWGSMDPWTRTIRVYDNGRAIEDIIEVLLHETLHSIEQDLKLDAFSGSEGHDELDILGIALADFLIRNNWINLKDFKNKKGNKR